MADRKQSETPWLAALLIAVVFVLIAYFGAKIIRVVQSSASSVHYTAVETETVRDLCIADNCFIYYDGSSIHCINENGRERWNYAFGGSASLNATSDGVALWKGRQLVTINLEKGETEISLNMDSEVLSAEVGSKYISVLLGPEHNSTCLILERRGRKVNSFTVEDETVIRTGFFSGGSLLWVMSLNTTGTSPSCTIKTYRPGKEIVGTISDSEQMLYDVVFENNTFRCTGDTYIKSFDYTGLNEDTSARKLVYGWFLAAVDESASDPLMAFVPIDEYSSSDHMQNLRLIRKNLDQQMRMPYPCFALTAKDDCVYGFSADGYLMIAREGETEVDCRPLSITPTKFYGITVNHKIVVEAEGRIYLLSLSK